MTLITHYVSSISQQEDFVWVIFKEKVSNDSMAKYLDKAAESWKGQGMPGKMPLSVMNQLREQRFKNEFEMKFPYILWTKRNLKIHDTVEINMPLQLSDIKTKHHDLGV